MNHYDVIILGGGLAGLTLSIQLKRKKPDIKILVLERRRESAPKSAHKVGESTVELASYYYREIIGVKDYLEKHELPKYGLRFKKLWRLVASATQRQVAFTSSP